MGSIKYRKQYLHLVGCPHASRLRHPFSGVDACVDPDGGTLVSSGAELNTMTDVELDSTDRRLELPSDLRKGRQLDKGGVGILV